MIGVYADPEGDHHTLNPPALNEPTSVFVVLKSAAGRTGAYFALPFPECIPYEVVGWSAMPDVIAQGDLETGVFVEFSYCVTLDLPLLRIDLVRTGETMPGCCRLQLAPPIGLFEIQVVPCPGYPDWDVRDCDIWLQGESACIEIEAPSDPSPPDGSVDVPVDVLLDCVIHRSAFTPRCAYLSFTWTSVYFGTSTDPPLVGNGGPIPFDPANVAPGTTYYWRVVYRDLWADPISSPIWTFTTTNATPAETSSWGMIKSLYR